MKKISINHFVKDPSFSNGVTNYIKAVNDVLDKEKRYTEVSKPYQMNMESFREYIYTYIKQNNLSSKSIIECAESQSASLFANNNENIHIRMHCPFYLFKKIIHEAPDENRFSCEVRAMYKAKAVSSPSHGMLYLLRNELDIDNIHVYKNPIVNRLELFKNKKDKKIDVIFFSRFNKLKGIEYVEKLINLLPSDFNILIVGKQEHKIRFFEEHHNVEILEHIEGDEKFELLSSAKVAISLSKFENCSMAILEALSVGTPVVAWDVGGNSEMAPPPILRVAPLGEVNEFAKLILEQHEEKHEYDNFFNVIRLLQEDFIKGLEHVEEYILGNRRNIYKGIDFSEEHYKLTSMPELLNKEERMLPVNITFLTSNLASARFFHKHFNNDTSGLNCKIIYTGNYGSEIKNITYKDLGKNTTLSNLEKTIKSSLSDVIVFHESFPLFINSIYKLKTSLKKATLFCENSVLDKGGYLLNQLGFNSESSIYRRRMRDTSKYISLSKGKALVWAWNIRSLKEIDIEKFNLFVQKHEEFDIVGDLSLFDGYLDDKKLTVIEKTSVHHSEYKYIYSCTDIGLDQFFEYENAIVLINEESVYQNKNIDNSKEIQLGSSYIDIGTRKGVLSYLKSMDYTFSKKDAFEEIYKVLDMEKYSV